MWKVIYHPKVRSDLDLLGYAESRRIEKVIVQRIINGEPDKIGNPLSGDLAGYRRLRVSNTRIVYRVHKKEIEIFIIAIGIRRDELVYHSAKSRQIT